VNGDYRESVTIPCTVHYDNFFGSAPYADSFGRIVAVVGKKHVWRILNHGGHYGIFFGISDENMDTGGCKFRTVFRRRQLTRDTDFGTCNHFGVDSHVVTVFWIYVK